LIILYLLTRSVGKRIVDVNAKNSKGYTPLSFAALRGTRLHVRSLIEAGSDPDTPSNSGTPLRIACVAGASVIFLYLIHSKRYNGSIDRKSNSHPDPNPTARLQLMDISLSNNELALAFVHYLYIFKMTCINAKTFRQLRGSAGAHRIVRAGRPADRPLGGRERRGEPAHHRHPGHPL
jgi:hypothetical protein